MRDMIVSANRPGQLKNKMPNKSEDRQSHTGGVHHAADDEPRGRAASQVQGWAVLHAQMPNQSALGKEVRRQLDRTAKSGPDHGRANASVQALDTLAPVDLTKAIEGPAIVVLRAHWEKRRV